MSVALWNYKSVSDEPPRVRHLSTLVGSAVCKLVFSPHIGYITLSENI